MKWIDVFSAGLIGSLLTLIITRAFDYFTKRQDNDFQFRKILFERKLPAAELAIGQMTFMYATIAGLASMFRGLIKQESQAGSQYNETVINQLIARLSEYQSKLENLAQPTLLYFNIEDLLLQTAIFSELQLIIDNLGKKGEQHHQLTEQYLANPHDDALDKASDAAFEDVQKQMCLIADSLDRFVLNVQEIIRRIKDELKHYNVHK